MDKEIIPAQDGVVKFYLQYKGDPSSRSAALIAVDTHDFASVFEKILVRRFPSQFKNLRNRERDFRSKSPPPPYRLSLLAESSSSSSNASEDLDIDICVLKKPFAHNKVFEVERMNTRSSSAAAAAAASSAASTLLPSLGKRKAVTDGERATSLLNTKNAKAKLDAQSLSNFSLMSRATISSVLSFLPLNELCLLKRVNNLWNGAANDAVDCSLNRDETVAVSSLVNSDLFMPFLRSKHIPGNRIRKLEILDGLFLSEHHLQDLLDVCGAPLRFLCLRNMTSINHSIIDRIPMLCAHLERIELDRCQSSPLFINNCYRHLSVSLQSLKIRYPRFIAVPLPQRPAAAPALLPWLHHHQPPAAAAQAPAAAAAPSTKHASFGFCDAYTFIAGKLNINAGGGHPFDGEIRGDQIVENWSVPHAAADSHVMEKLTSLDVVYNSKSDFSAVRAHAASPDKVFETTIYTLMSLSSALEKLQLVDVTAAAGRQERYRLSAIRMSPSSIRNILCTLSSLTELKLSFHSFDENSVRLLARALPSLERLSLPSYYLDPKSRLSPHFASFRALKFLEFEDMALTEDRAWDGVTSANCAPLVRELRDAASKNPQLFVSINIPTSSRYGSYKAFSIKINAPAAFASVSSFKSYASDNADSLTLSAEKKETALEDISDFEDPMADCGYDSV